MLGKHLSFRPCYDPIGIILQIQIIFNNIEEESTFDVKGFMGKIEEKSLLHQY